MSVAEGGAELGEGTLREPPNLGITGVDGLLIGRSGALRIVLLGQQHPQLNRGYRRHLGVGGVDGLLIGRPGALRIVLRGQQHPQRGRGRRRLIGITAIGDKGPELSGDEGKPAKVSAGSRSVAFAWGCQVRDLVPGLIEDGLGFSVVLAVGEGDEEVEGQVGRLAAGGIGDRLQQGDVGADRLLGPRQGLGQVGLRFGRGADQAEIGGIQADQFGSPDRATDVHAHPVDGGLHHRPGVGLGALAGVVVAGDKFCGRDELFADAGLEGLLGVGGLGGGLFGAD